MIEMEDKYYEVFEKLMFVIVGLHFATRVWALYFWVDPPTY